MRFEIKSAHLGVRSKGGEGNELEDFASLFTIIPKSTIRVDHKIPGKETGHVSFCPA